MTFDLILSSLNYHGREWFVFQDILTHLPPEKAAVANERSKSTSKYTYRFGITRDWVTGDSKKTLVDCHFIDSNDPGRSLIFSSVLIDAERVEELFRESFSKKFRLKVQQFQLTANSLDSCWFEWHFDPKQKDNCVVKKTKLTVEENDRQSSLRSKATEKTPRKDRQSDSENLTPNLSQQANDKTSDSPPSLKRRRATMENGSSEENQRSSTPFVPTISESVLMRPRLAKKAKEQLDEKPNIFQEKKEPISPNFTPDIKYFPHLENIKKSPKTEPSSPQRIVKEDVMLNSGTAIDNNTHSDTDDDDTDDDDSPGTNKSEEISFQNNEDSTISDNICQDDMSLVDQDMLDEGDIQNVGDTPGNGDIPSEVDTPGDGDTQSEVDIPGEDDILGEANGPDEGNIPDKVNIPVDGDIRVDGETPVEGNITEGSINTNNIPDSNIPDDGTHAPQNATPSPTSSLLDNSKTIMESIKLREKELCNDEEEVIVVEGESSEVPSTSADTSADAGGHKHDCGAESCSSNGASSTVCLCTNEETSKNETSGDKVGSKRESTEASELLDGLKAAGFVPLVRQLLENVQGKSDTRLSQMETELKTLGNQINQKRKANRQLQKSIKRKAGELEKLFENLRKGKAMCGVLEQKHRSLQVEKSTVEAKVKKCLEVLNSVD